MRSIAIAGPFRHHLQPGKAIFGAAVVGGFFAIGGFGGARAVPPLQNAKNYQRKSLLQYSILMVFFLTMIALPIKMLLRLCVSTLYV